MTERLRPNLRRWRPPARYWPFGVVVILAAGVLLDGVLGPDLLRLATPDRTGISGVRAAMAPLPEDPLVLVGMDADLGTYPEIRPAVRAALQDLLDRGASLAMVSFSPEGRAIAAAELERLQRDGVPQDRLLDLGFVAGAEAGLVLAVTNLTPANGALPDGALGSATRGIRAFDMALVVGGIDFGPRSWVEQVATRIPQLPLVAVVPTFMRPEVAPYLRTGQLSALIGTVRDVAAYADWVAEASPPAAGQGSARGGAPAPLAMLLGMLIGLAALGAALRRARGIPGMELPAEPEEGT